MAARDVGAEGRGRVCRVQARAAVPAVRVRGAMVGCVRCARAREGSPMMVSGVELWISKKCSNVPRFHLIGQLRP